MKCIKRLIARIMRRYGLCVADVRHLESMERELSRLRKLHGVSAFGTERVAVWGDA